MRGGSVEVDVTERKQICHVGAQSWIGYGVFDLGADEVLYSQES